MANVNIYISAVLDSGTSVNTATLQSARRGSLINKGPSTVFLGWSSDTVNANTSAEVGKSYLDSGDAMRIPAGVKNFAHVTATGSAKLLFVEE